MQSKGFGRWGLFEEFMASLVLLISELDTKRLGLFPSPTVIKGDCELQLQYFTPSSSASQLKAELSWKQNPSRVPSPKCRMAHRSLPLAEKSGRYLTGGIYCFVASKVKSILMENGSSDSRETTAFDWVPCVQLNPPFACEVCSGYILAELFHVESGSFSSRQEKRQNIWYVVWDWIYYKVFILKAFYDL